MDKEKRMNQNYEIVKSCPIGANSEVVIGYNKNAPDPYVCWLCHNKTDYIWGRYCQSLERAEKQMQVRCQAVGKAYQPTHNLVPKGRDTHER